MKVLSKAFLALALFLLSLAAFFSYLWPGVPVIYVFLGLSGALVLLTFFIDLPFYKELLLLKSTRHGLNMGVLCLFTFTFIVAINYFASNFNKTFDVSKDKISTLNPLTQKILKQLPEKIDVKIFSSRGRRAVRNLESTLDLYKKSHANFHIEYINPLSYPQKTKDFIEKTPGASINENLMVFLEYKGRTAFVESPYGEEQWSTTLRKLSSSKKTKVYFVYGHGQRSLSKTPSGRDVHLLKEALESFSFEIQSLFLLKEKALPKDAQFLVILGPSKKFLPKELNLLQNHLKAGGSLFIALEPGSSTNLDQFLEKFGVTFDNNFLIDRSSGLEDGVLAAITYHPSHNITKGFQENQKVTLYPTVSSFSGKTQKGYHITTLVQSSPRSFAIKQFKSQKVKVTPKPYPLILEVTTAQDSKQKKFKLLVSGDVDFLSSAYFSAYFNKDLAMNIFNDLSGQTQFISFPKKTPPIPPFVLTTTRQATLALATFFPPLILLTLSFIFWLRGRKQ